MRKGLAFKITENYYNKHKYYYWCTHQSKYAAE
jgi:hypothetical protein